MCQKKSTTFDLEKMMKLAKNDKFIAFCMKGNKPVNDPKIVFNTYVLGDSIMEAVYAKIS